jgi:hypothetical protein
MQIVLFPYLTISLLSPISSKHWIKCRCLWQPIIWLYLQLFILRGSTGLEPPSWLWHSVSTSLWPLPLHRPHDFALIILLHLPRGPHKGLSCISFISLKCLKLQLLRAAFHILPSTFLYYVSLTLYYIFIHLFFLLKWMLHCKIEADLKDPFSKIILEELKYKRKLQKGKIFFSPVMQTSIFHKLPFCTESSK